MQLSPQRHEGAHGNMGDLSVVCALLLKLCWDQRLREALIRGQMLSQVSCEPGPPTCTVPPDLKLHSRLYRYSPADCKDPAKSLGGQTSKRTSALNVYCIILIFTVCGANGGNKGNIQKLPVFRIWWQK